MRLQYVMTGGLAAVLLSSTAYAQNPTPPRGYALPPASAAASLAKVISTVEQAKPMERKLDKLPAAALSTAPPPAATGLPEVRAGQGPKISSPGAGIVVRSAAAQTSNAEIETQNYGNNPFGSGTNKNTVYHYTDRRAQARNVYPNIATGHLAFTTSGGGSFRCSASLIRPSILVTAGHCVHDGGNGASGWIQSGYFVPGRDNDKWPFGYATVNWINTTGGWYGTGNIDAGYDVGVAVLNPRAGTSTQIGFYTGWYSYCVSNCLQPYWYLTQLGYPGNYDSGTKLQEGQHLEVNRINTDYYHGSGMQGGSSGGPHIANLGELADSASNQGNWTVRNVVFAVTSWGYTDSQYKIQGASTLTGPNNANNWTALFQSACNRATQLYGSC